MYFFSSSGSLQLVLNTFVYSEHLLLRWMDGWKDVSSGCCCVTFAPLGFWKKDAWKLERRKCCVLVQRETRENLRDGEKWSPSTPVRNWLDWRWKRLVAPFPQCLWILVSSPSSSRLLPPPGPHPCASLIPFWFSLSLRYNQFPEKSLSMTQSLYNHHHDSSSWIP